MVDIQVSKNFAKKYTVSLDIQNIFDNEYIDRKGYLSPGRFITAEIKIKF
jgi:outer membrane receptor protein involved in Fe transport